ncbi:MAG: replication initiator protein [Microvirus sp.]|nr:MAG: replication initiator protein [Microvirus sp.]
MSCAGQLEAYRPALGGPVVFNKPTNGRAYTPIQLPCGQCILCRLEHARQWAVRITHEAQLWETSSFITLTYDDEHLPNQGSLDYSHLQKFWKRLRKARGPLRYYAVGEYGDNTLRPHYHACVFGHAFTENRLILRTEPTMLWTSPQLNDAWGMGHVSVGALTFQTAQYTASYVTKKLNNKRRYVTVNEETGELEPLIQPRAFMSLRPAIGRDWLDLHGKAVYDHDRVIINGTAQKPPKYYDRWLEKIDESKAETIKIRRRKQIRHLSKEQTHARARNAHARAKIKSKSV